MNDVEALDLITRFSNRMPIPWSPDRIHEWANGILPWDYTAATAALGQFATLAKPGSFNDLEVLYTACYRQIGAATRQLPRWPTNEDGQCVECNGTGWVEIPDSATARSNGDALMPCTRCDRDQAEQRIGRREVLYEVGERERIRAMIREARARLITAPRPSDRDLRAANLKRKADREGVPFDPDSVGDHPDDNTPWPMRQVAYLRNDLT